MTDPNAKRSAGFERAVEAVRDEGDRWIMRDAVWLNGFHEVCRVENFDVAGAFSEVHQFKTEDEAVEALADLRDAAIVRVVVAAVREPDEGMIEAGEACDSSRPDAEFNAGPGRHWQAMIDHLAEGFDG